MSARVAWVTGASRGIGRGVAVALGAAGWTVWVTARSSRSSGATSHLGGTVEDTAAAVDMAGGRGVAVVCDHRDDAAVRSVVERIASSGLDVLVNNAWGGYERLVVAGGPQEWGRPFWEQPVELWDRMFASGVRAHYVATALAAPLLRARRGVVVTVSMEVGAAHDPEHNVPYNVAKAADERLVQATAGQLAGSGVASVGLYPGLVRTEGVLQAADFFDLTESQSPEGVGRVVAALAADPKVMALTGRSLRVEDLARRYGVDVAR